LDAKKLRHAIFAGHVSDYMRRLAEDDPAKYQKQFSQYIKAGIEPDQLEKLIAETHRKIRANPEAVLTTKHKPEQPKRFGTRPKLTLAERRANLESKKKKLAGASDENQDE